MKIYIKAKPKARKAYIKKIDDIHYVVAVNEPPVSGKANQAIIKSLSGYFGKPSSQITITSGETSRLKIVEIPVTLEEVKALEAQKKLF